MTKQLPSGTSNQLRISNTYISHSGSGPHIFAGTKIYLFTKDESNFQNWFWPTNTLERSLFGSKLDTCLPPWYNTWIGEISSEKGGL